MHLVIFLGWTWRHLRPRSAWFFSWKLFDGFSFSCDVFDMFFKTTYGNGCVDLAPLTKHHHSKVLGIDIVLDNVKNNKALPTEHACIVFTGYNIKVHLFSLNDRNTNSKLWRPCTASRASPPAFAHGNSLIELASHSWHSMSYLHRRDDGTEERLCWPLDWTLALHGTDPELYNHRQIYMHSACIRVDSWRKLFVHIWYIW